MEQVIGVRLQTVASMHQQLDLGVPKSRRGAAPARPTELPCLRELKHHLSIGGNAMDPRYALLQRWLIYIRVGLQTVA